MPTHRHGTLGVAAAQPWQCTALAWRNTAWPDTVMALHGIGQALIAWPPLGHGSALHWHSTTGKATARPWQCLTQAKHTMAWPRHATAAQGTARHTEAWSRYGHDSAWHWHGNPRHGPGPAMTAPGPGLAPHGLAPARPWPGKAPHGTGKAIHGLALARPW